MAKQNKLTVGGIEIKYYQQNEEDFFSLTDIAKKYNERTDQIISNWLRRRMTVDFLGTWETFHNANFNPLNFEGIRNQTGTATFVLSVSDWVEQTEAIGIRAKAGRYGGTYAHKDIALEFLSYLDPSFKLYVLKEFQRLKEEEQMRLGDPFNIKRYLTTGNYSLLVAAVLSQTDERLLTHPQPYKGRLPFASESDMLNKIVFGKTAKEWRKQNTDKPIDRNQRDYAKIVDLVILNNLEFLDAMLLNWEIDKKERENILKDAYKFQYPILNRSKTLEKIQTLADKGKE